LDKAYAQRLFDGRHPIAYLFLEVPAEDLDVNIHPNKREVRFHREAEIEEFIRSALTNTLQRRDAIPGLDKEGSFNASFNQIAKTNNDKPQDSKQVDIISLLSSLREQQNIIAEKTIVSTETSDAKVPSEIPNQTPLMKTMESVDNRFHPETLTSLGVAFGTYIVATDEDTLYLIDQHAAHERILFEQIMAQMDKREKFRQVILMPFTVQCSITESQASDTWLHVLSEIGYTLEPFGPNTYLVKEIPGFLSHEEAELFISDFLDHVTDDTALNDRKMLTKAASNACKEAVKGREHLSPEEIDELFIQLSQCENPLSCPHGRPTFIRFPQHEIQRKFRRT